MLFYIFIQIQSEKSRVQLCKRTPVTWRWRFPTRGQCHSSWDKATTHKKISLPSVYKNCVQKIKTRILKVINSKFISTIAFIALFSYLKLFRHYLDYTTLLSGYNDDFGLLDLGGVGLGSLARQSKDSKLEDIENLTEDEIRIIRRNQKIALK